MSARAESRAEATGDAVPESLFRKGAVVGIDPATLPNRTLRLDADIASTLTIDIDGVAEIRDADGNGRDFGQATGSLEPAKVTDGIQADDDDFLDSLGNGVRMDDLHPNNVFTAVHLFQTPAVIDTYKDHRMAMSFAIAGLKLPGIVIRDPGCTAKTYPRFFNDLDEARGS